VRKHEGTELIVYTRMLIPLDGSQAAEQVLPYARFLAKGLAIPVELLEVIDPDALAGLANPERGRYLDTLLTERTASSRAYLQTVAGSLQGSDVRPLVQTGKPEDVLIEHAAADKGALIVMASHGRSGIQRWLLGSVADKVLHGAANHVLLIHASDTGETSGEAVLKKVLVPLDGSSLAEQVLPWVVDLAKKMTLDVILSRAYALPLALSLDEYGTYTEQLIGRLEADAREYLATRVEDLKQRGIENVSSVVDVGYGAGEIIKLARETPDNFVAMCTHGRSGIRRWVLGSVTERVVRHCGDPVLIIRAS
jgi:nucleotide-binding universal stress UspA family protein